MTVNSIGALYKKDGSFASVNEQGVVLEYEEIYQEEFDAILAERVANGDFTEAQLNDLLDTYFYAYCTEADFKLIRDMGLNTIRLPMFISFGNSPNSNTICLAAFCKFLARE